MNKKGNKKGISLVELTIAMTILTMVFAGTVTLIIMVVNLSYSSGLKTVAISLAQKGLTDKITEFRASPNNSANYCPTTPITTGLPDGIESLTKCIIKDPANVPDGAGLSGPDNFVMVTSEVAWYIREGGSLSTYQMSQVIRKSYP